MPFARRVLCNGYDARLISKTKSQNTRKWRNGGIINVLFDGLTYNISGYFATRKISALFMLTIEYLFMNLHKILIITTLYTTIKNNTTLSSKSDKPF